MRISYILFVLLLISNIFLPAPWPFMALVAFIAVHLAIGFFRPSTFDTIARIMGVYLMLIVLVEAAHAGTAYCYGIPIKGASVSLLGFDEGEGVGPSGWVELDVSEEDVDASPELQSQMSWVAAMGSIVLVVFGSLHFCLRRPSKSSVATPEHHIPLYFPAVVASILFVFHQIPIVTNDQWYMISQGWMSPLFAWGVFSVGLVVLMIAGIYAMKKREKRMPRRVGG